MKRRTARIMLTILSYLLVAPVAVAILVVTGANIILLALETFGAILLALVRWTRHDRNS